jgi:hypothetical protein
MSLSAFSLVIGVFSYVYGFPLVFSDASHLEWRKKLLKDENILRVVGTAFIALSVTTLRWNWRITADGEGFIVAVAWLTLAKALFMAWWPKSFSRIENRIDDKFFSSPQMLAFQGFVMVLLGALFTYMGLILA